MVVPRIKEKMKVTSWTFAKAGQRTFAKAETATATATEREPNGIT